jgi:hypothetical protein
VEFDASALRRKDSRLASQKSKDKDFRMPQNIPEISRSFRFAAGVAVFIHVLMSSGSAVFANSDRANLIKRFDQRIIPAVEKAVQNPVTDRGGEIAWGTSYQLSALVEMLDATRDPKYAELFVKLSDWVARSRDDRHGRRDDMREQVVAAWSSTNYSKGTRYAWAVHTGMIVAPMARFSAVIRSDPALTNRWSKDADRLLKIAEEAVAVHEKEYREGPRPDEGYVYCPYLKKYLPLNMQNALARAWMAIDDATGTPKHREKITRLAQYLKHRLRPMDDGSYVWAYWPPLEGNTDKFEDISHAAINADFMVRCFEHNIVFQQEDTVRLEKTLLKRVLLPNDRISDTVGGGGKFNSHRSAVLHWERLGRHSPEVRERLARLSQLPEFARDITAQAVGIVHLSMPPSLTNKPSGK